MLVILTLPAGTGATALASDAVPPDEAADRRLALDPGPDGARALARVLRGFHDRGDGEGGFAWWMRLPFSVRARQVESPEVKHWRYRVEFLRDAGRGDAAACRFSGGVVLRGPVATCDYAAEVRRYLDCTGKHDIDELDAELDPGPDPVRARLREQAETCSERGEPARQLR